MDINIQGIQSLPSTQFYYCNWNKKGVINLRTEGGQSCIDTTAVSYHQLKAM